jgi:hypothetical protein
MKDVFAKLATDFLSTILFLVLFRIIGDVVLATGISIAGAVAQVVYSAVDAKLVAFAVQHVAFRLLVDSMGLGLGMRYTAAANAPAPRTISGFAKKQREETLRWPSTETGTSP